jgi:hypothetical protein
VSEYVNHISYVQHEGLKAHDARREFTGADVFRGNNGQSKTTILDTIRLVGLGYTVGVKKTNQDVFSLARPGVDRIRLLLGGIRTDGRKVEIERRWTRGRGGAISESIRIDGQNLGTRDGEAAITALLPWLTEAWEPAAIFREGAAAMRSRILDLVPPTLITPYRGASANRHVFVCLMFSSTCNAFTNTWVFGTAQAIRQLGIPRYTPWRAPQ